MKTTTRLAATLAVTSSLSLGCGGGTSTCDPTVPNTICTIAGSGEQGYDGDDGPATEAALYVPQDTVLGANGDLWILDFNNYLVRTCDTEGIIRTVIGTGLLGDSPPVDVPSVPAAEATFNHTTDLFFDDGYLYMAAWHNSRVKRVELSTMRLENFAGIGKRTLYTGDGGPALMGALDLPSSIALHPDGGIVIMDQANQVIRKVGTDGNIDRIAGSCVVDYDFPCAADQVPAACPDSNKTVCGDPATECGKPCTPGYGGDDGPALEARMAQPYGQMADPAGRIAYDQEGNLYFADSNNHRIRRVGTDGMISTVAGTGESGFSGDGGPATAAKMNNPVDVEIGDDGTIYFTDVYNSCVRQISQGGIISTVAGVCSNDPTIRGFDGDGGLPTEAKLNRPYGIDVVGRKLYVSDSYNNRIRVVNL